MVDGGKILDTTNICDDILTHVDENIDKWNGIFLDLILQLVIKQKLVSGCCVAQLV